MRVFGYAPSGHVWVCLYYGFIVDSSESVFQHVLGHWETHHVDSPASLYNSCLPLAHLQWGKKVFSQPPIVQVLPLKKMREACNFHHRYTSTMRDKIRKKTSRKSHCRIFKEFICKLWWKISIWSITKFNLNTLLYILCWQWQRSNIFCKSSKGFHTLLLVFWPIPPCRSPLEQWCFGAAAGQHGLSTPSKDFEIWRLARPLQDLEMLLTKPLLHCPGGVFGIIVMLKDPATFHLQCPCWWKEVFTQNLTIHGPIHSFLYTDQSSWSLCRKTAPKHDVSTPMLHSRYGVLWMQLSILSPPNTTSWVFTKKFYFGFIWPYDILPILFWIIQMLSSKLQTGLDMYWLKQGDTSGTAGFESLAAQCVTDGSLCYFGPSSLQVIH